MARSVGVASESVAVAYTTFGDCGEEGEDAYVDAHDWDDLVTCFQEQVVEKWPSFDVADEWHDREGRVIAENVFARIVVYEHCGLVSLCLIPNPRHDNEAWARRWCEKIAHRFTAQLSTLRKIGTASNGEAFFEAIPRRTPVN